MGQFIFSNKNLSKLTQVISNLHNLGQIIYRDRDFEASDPHPYSYTFWEWGFDILNYWGSGFGHSNCWGWGSLRGMPYPKQTIYSVAYNMYVASSLKISKKPFYLRHIYTCTCALKVIDFLKTSITIFICISFHVNSSGGVLYSSYKPWRLNKLFNSCLDKRQKLYIPYCICHNALGDIRQTLKQRYLWFTKCTNEK